MIKYYRYSLSTYFCFDPFKSPYSCFDIRQEYLYIYIYKLKRIKISFQILVLFSVSTTQLARIGALLIYETLFDPLYTSLFLSLSLSLSIYIYISKRERENSPGYNSGFNKST